LKTATRPRIHTFIGTSPLHRQHISTILVPSGTMAASLSSNAFWAAKPMPP
jgi:hypothetical protein